MDVANVSVSPRLTIIAALLSLTAGSASAVQPHSSDYATQGFLFDWDNLNADYPTPITAQCETLSIRWNRGAGTGPDPIPPYYLRIYSSAPNNTVDSFQLVNAGTTSSTQLQIPFPPGTLYVICMTDSSGVNGGCQNVYTVYPSPTNQSCTGFTPPASNLGMNAISSATGSTLSRWGWPNSCTDIQLQPIDDKNGGIKGTPPYTLTVVPAYNNPLNITFDQSVAWTITLAHSTPFFLSVSDANGVTWTDGPMHAGAGDTSCLTSTAPQSGLSASTTIGTAIGSFLLGGILAALVFWLVVRRHRNQGGSYHFDRPPPSPLDSMSPRRESNHPTFTPLAGGANTEIHSYMALDNSVDRSRKRPNNYGPLDSPTPNSARQRTPDGRSSPPGSSIPLRHRNSTSSHFSATSPTGGNPPPSSSSINPTSSPPAPGAVPVHEVFVVHHDAGAPPPVTVYALPGSRVTELPPGYDFGGRRSSDNANRSQPPLTLLGDPVSPSSTLYSRRDQKASYTPRSGTTFSPPPEPPSPNISSADERARAANETRLLPSTPYRQPPTPTHQTPSMPDLPTSMTPRTRGPRQMSPPDDSEREIWKTHGSDYFRGAT